MRTGPQGRAPQTPLLATDPAEGGAGEAHRQDDAPPVADRAASEAVRPPSRGPEAVLRSLSSLPTELDRLIDGRPDEVLKQPAEDGGWGVVEILSHLRDWEVVVHERVWAMLEQDQPRLTMYDDSLWAIERNYREQRPRQVFGRFRELRETLVARVEGIDEAAWQRAAIHPRRGQITVHWLLDRLCDHDVEHLDQARDVLG